MEYLRHSYDYNVGATAIGSIDDASVAEYLETLSELIWQSVADYGLSNLRDVDVRLKYDTPKGYLYMDDGFVVDISDISMSVPNMVPSIDEYSVNIKSKLTLNGLTLAREFRYEAIVEEPIQYQTTGTVLVKPEKYYFSFEIWYNITTGVTKPTLESSGQIPGENLLTYYPENALTARLKKMYSKMYSQSILDGLDVLWHPVFKPMFLAAVNKTAFPTVKYPTTRQFVQL